METVVTLVGLFIGLISLLLMWKSRTDTLLTEIRDVLIQIRDTPPIINVVPKPKP